MILLAANGIVQVVGTWNYYARVVGSFCGSLLGCVNLAAIITTAVFRFNNIGRLAALSETPSKYEGALHNNHGTMITSNISNEHTYESDADLIMWLFIAQIIFFCTNCCYLGWAAKPPNADAMQSHGMTSTTYAQINDGPGY